MDSQTLLEKKHNSVSELPLVLRYNVFIKEYNSPTCIIDQKALTELPQSCLHNQFILLFGGCSGKILLFFLLLIPCIDILILLLCLYSLIFYCRCLDIHKQNCLQVEDPFLNMVYDHDLCYKLGKDYHSFRIDFKELEGFSVNYRRNLQKEKFREERGKISFFIYNGNFWASFHNFPKWTNFHLIITLLSVAMTVGINLAFFIWLL